MAFRKVKDVAVVTGSYTDSSGQTKNRYMNVGSVLKGDDGSSMILLSRAFNPAGVPFRADKPDQIILSLFDPRPADGAAPATTQRAAAPAPTREPGVDDDDIPF
jgi:hypothetical protein